MEPSGPQDSDLAGQPDVVGDGESSGDEPLARLVWLADLPFWATSAALHLLLVLVLLTMVVDDGRRDQSASNALRVRAAKKLLEYDPVPRRDVKKLPKLVARKRVEIPVIQRKIEEVTADIPKGTDLASLTNVELLSTMVNDSIGMGGGAAGAYGERWGEGR